MLRRPLTARPRVRHMPGRSWPTRAWDDLRLLGLKLIFRIVTRAVSLPGWSRRERWWKDAEILMLRHQLAVAERERPRAHSRLAWPDRAWLALLAGTVPAWHVGTDPLPADAWADAVTGARTPEADRSERQCAGVALAARLAGELAEADAVLLAVPLYNFGVSQHIKTWIDLVIAAPRDGSGANGTGPLLAGKPTVLVTVRGGAYGAGTPRDGWDHSTGYLRRILADVWGAELTVVEREFTLVGVNPALDQFTELAAQLKDAAHAAAREAGRALTAAVPA